MMQVQLGEKARSLSLENFTLCCSILNLSLSLPLLLSTYQNSYKTRYQGYMYGLKYLCRCSTNLARVTFHSFMYQYSHTLFLYSSIINLIVIIDGFHSRELQSGGIRLTKAMMAILVYTTKEFN